MTSSDLAKYIRELAAGERALAEMGHELASLAAELLEFVAEAIAAGAAPPDVIARLKDLSADMAAARAGVQDAANKKFGGQ